MCEKYTPDRAKKLDKIESKIVKQDKIEKKEIEKKYGALISYIQFWDQNVPYISFRNKGRGTWGITPSGIMIINEQISTNK